MSQRNRNQQGNRTGSAGARQPTSAKRTGTSPGDRSRRSNAARTAAGRATATSRTGNGSASADDRTRPGPTAPRRRRRWVLLTLLSLVTALVVGLYATPVLGVRSVRVTGNSTLSEDELLQAARVREGKPMPRINTDEIRSRLNQLPKVASAEVTLSWPSTIKLEVAERVPAAFLFTGKKFELVDASGVRFGSRQQPPAKLPELKMPSRPNYPGPNDPASRAAMTVLRSLSPRIQKQTVAVIVRSPDAINLRLRGDRRVRWGGPEESARKAAILPALLTAPGSVYDVITPALPTVS